MSEEKLIQIKQKDLGISVSSVAEKQIDLLAKKREVIAKALRVGIRGGGCNGYKYIFEWSDENPNQDDIVILILDSQVSIYIDRKSLLFLNGATLVYSEKLVNRGFKWENPNEKRSCGCGQSIEF